MKLLNQLFSLVFILTLTTSCSGQSDSAVDNNHNERSRENRLPEIPENLRMQDQLVKQICSLQRELRDLKIQAFVNQVNELCDISDEISELKFLLETKSGELIKYTVDGNKVELPCIKDRLLRIHWNFGEMSYGFNNGFRMKPTSQFVISP